MMENDKGKRPVILLIVLAIGAYCGFFVGAGLFGQSDGFAGFAIFTFLLMVTCWVWGHCNYVLNHGMHWGWGLLSLFGPFGSLALFAFVQHRELMVALQRLERSLSATPQRTPQYTPEARASVKTCLSCGAHIPADAAFCQACGASARDMAALAKLDPAAREMAALLDKRGSGNSKNIRKYRFKA